MRRDEKWFKRYRASAEIRRADAATHARELYRWLRSQGVSRFLARTTASYHASMVELDYTVRAHNEEVERRMEA